MDLELFDGPQARDIGNAASIPLGISSTDVQLGERLHETPHSTIHKATIVSSIATVVPCLHVDARDC